MTRILPLLLTLVVLSSAASAHSVHEADTGGVAANDIVIAAIIVSLLVLFAVGWKHMPRKRSGEPPIATWRATLFVGGMLLLAAALLPPFDELADRYFSAHMAQHLVLLVVAPPMLAASQAHLILLHAFPLRFRRRFGRAVGGVPGLRFAARHSSTIWFVCLSSVAVLWFWHLPQVYDWARRHEAVHDAEHLLFLATELAFWRVILFRREKQLSRAAAALILVGMSVQGGLLAALITLAGKPLYLSYGTDSAAIADQALGGVMMWVLAGTIYLAAFACLFASALARAPSAVRRTPDKLQLVGSSGNVDAKVVREGC